MKRLILSLALVLAIISNCPAQSSLIEQESADNINQEFDYELRTPMVDSKLHIYVRSYMKSLAESLYLEGYEVETMRDGEVVIAVIPTDILFAPNDSVLMPMASAKLERFRQYASPYDRFKIILAVHSDDTGSESYLYKLTESRTEAIIDYMISIGFNPEKIIGFPKGNSAPIAESTSRANRAKNRRLEIFIVPSEELLTQARQSKKN